MPSQNVSLPTELLSYVSSQVESGKYASVSEVHRSAIRRLQQDEERELIYRERVNQLLEEGERDLAEGRVIKIDAEKNFEDFFEQLDGETTQKLKADYA